MSFSGIYNDSSTIDFNQEQEADTLCPKDKLTGPNSIYIYKGLYKSSVTSNYPLNAWTLWNWHDMPRLGSVAMTPLKLLVSGPLLSVHVKSEFLVQCHWLITIICNLRLLMNKTHSLKTFFAPFFPVYHSLFIHNVQGTLQDHTTSCYTERRFRLGWPIGW